MGIHLVRAPISNRPVKYEIATENAKALLTITVKILLH